MAQTNIKLVKNHLLAATCLSTLFSIIPIFAYANPIGGKFKAGNGEISDGHIVTNGNAVIEWDGFDIGVNEITRFIQPSPSSVVLNRVISSKVSNIDGQLIANGNIIIINQNGIKFGAGSRVDANGIIASTIDIDNDMVMNNSGKLHFNKPGKIDASIINNGRITAKDAGLVGLVAPMLENNGAIIVNSGRIELASGDSFTVDMYGDKLVEVAVSDQLKSQLIRNNGLLEAEGGKIIITMAAGKEIINNLIEIKGELKAPAVGVKNGEIFIFAEGSNSVINNIEENKGIISGKSQVIVAARLDASGLKTGERGGKITVTGDNVALLDGAVIDARGFDGLSDTINGLEKSAQRIGSAGGDIQIGGDYLGGGNTPTAMNLYVAPGVSILNDAINSGDAGRSIFWSDGTTEFHGEKISARALGSKGDGGFVETSDQTLPNLTASNGKKGTHFLDPANIVIYGNVNPKFVSTDETVNLPPNLKLWLDASDSKFIALNYNDISTTATGNMGSSTLTLSSIGPLVVGAKIRLANASLGDTYIVESISGSTITLTNNLTSNYSGSEVYAGYVSTWRDKSGQSNDATHQSTSSMPLWLSNQQNGNSVLNFDGTSQGLNVNLGFLNDETNGYNSVPHTNFVSAKTNVYGSFYQEQANGGSVYEGFNLNDAVINYKMDYTEGGDTLAHTGVSQGSITPSSAFVEGDYNNVVFQWNREREGSDFSYPNTKIIYANTNKELVANNAGTIGAYQRSASIGNGDAGTLWGGAMAEIMMYNEALSIDNIYLLSQYQSAKWNIPMVPPGSGSTEAQKAMASTNRGDGTDGYSTFSTNYLNRLSQNADIDLVAGSNIILDLKGDTLKLADDASFSLTADGDISTVSSGSIKTKRTTSNGNIAISAGGNLNIPDLELQATNGGVITLSAVTGGGGNGIVFNPNVYADSGVNISINNSIYGFDPDSVQALSITGITANNKVYDGSTSATFTGTPSIASPATISGAATGVFLNSNAGISSLSLEGLAVNILGDGMSPPTSASYTYTSSSYFAQINKAPLTVTADNQSIIYGSPPPPFTYSYSGLVAGDLQANFLGILGSNASKPGSYEILRNTLIVTGNYQIEDYIPGIFTIIEPKSSILRSVYHLLNTSLFKGTVNFASTPITNKKSIEHLFKFAKGEKDFHMASSSLGSSKK